jgi:hypothetical protein
MNVRAKRLISWVTAAMAVAMAAWAAAPALSTNVYVPGGVDFEQALDGVQRIAPTGTAKRTAKEGDHGDEGPVTHRSAVIIAPQRFDLAGLARERRATELRARDEGGEWSEWVETTNGDPVYFGGADELQLRTRGYRPEGTLHYVNVSGTTSTTSSVLTSFRQAVNSAFITAASTLNPSAEALPTRPQIMSRAAWGADQAKGGCQPRTGPERGRVKAAVVHHTVTAAKYTEAEAPSIVLGICRFHRNGNGWNDIGYNALVDRFGNLYAGRAGGLRKPIVGAHAQGFNAQTTGVAVVGTHTTTPVTPAALNAMSSYLAWKLAAHGIAAQGKTTMTSAGGDASRYEEGKRVRLNRIIGHRQVGLTACPGDGLFAQLGKLRRNTQAAIDAGGGPAPPTEPTEPVPPDGGGVVPK